MKTLGEIVKWVLENRTGCAFKDYSEELIATEIIESQKDNVLRVSLDEEQNIVGIVCGRKFESKKIIYIYDILTTKAGVVKQFMNDCVKLYPDYAIHGTVASGRKRVFKNPMKLMERLQ